MNDLLKVVGEPVAWISLNTITGKTHLGIMPLQSLQAGVYNHAKLYTDDAIQAAHTKGQEDMRERAANACQKIEVELWARYKEQTSPEFCNQHTEGKSDG